MISICNDLKDWAPSVPGEQNDSDTSFVTVFLLLIKGTGVRYSTDFRMDLNNPDSGYLE